MPTMKRVYFCSTAPSFISRRENPTLGFRKIESVHLIPVSSSDKSHSVDVVLRTPFIAAAASDADAFVAHKLS